MKRKWACKPGFVAVTVYITGMIIYLGFTLLQTSSNLPGSHRNGPLQTALFGLAPNGVCPATLVTESAVSSYLAISTLPDSYTESSAVYFLWHFPSRRRAWPLASILPYGARTFLCLATATIRPTSRLQI